RPQHGTTPGHRARTPRRPQRTEEPKSCARGGDLLGGLLSTRPLNLIAKGSKLRLKPVAVIPLDDNDASLYRPPRAQAPVQGLRQLNYQRCYLRRARHQREGRAAAALGLSCQAHLSVLAQSWRCACLGPLLLAPALRDGIRTAFAIKDPTNFRGID